MIPFEMVEPTSLKEAMSLLDPEEPTVRPVAGGTALMLMMKAGVFQPSLLVCLHKIEPEHSRIAVAGDVTLVHRRCWATPSDVEHDANASPRVRSGAEKGDEDSVEPACSQRGAGSAVRWFTATRHIQIYRRYLQMLGAKVTIAGPKGGRELAVEDLYAGYYETVLEKDELITAVTVPVLNALQCRSRKY